MHLFPLCAIIPHAPETYPPVAKLDIAADSDSEGRGFESLRAGHKVQHPLYVGAVLFCFGGIRTLRGSERKKNRPVACFSRRGARRAPTCGESARSGTALPYRHPSGRAKSTASTLCGCCTFFVLEGIRTLRGSERKKKQAGGLFFAKRNTRRGPTCGESVRSGTALPYRHPSGRAKS